MKVLMLGWEYPPHISGGLGTACEGLTKAIARVGTEIVFVVPQLFGGEDAPHMSLVDPYHVPSTNGGGASVSSRKPGASMIQQHAVPSLLSPYATESTFKDFVKFFEALGKRTQGLSSHDLQSILYEAGGDPVAAAERLENVPGALPRASSSDAKKNRYGSTIFEEVDRFTAHVVNLAQSLEFDVIHAHDWMTYPAGVAVSRLTGKPLVCHVHSLEYDRSGENVNTRINEIEHFGLLHASHVVAVSYYTMGVIHRRHGVGLDKVSVIHNGVYSKEVALRYRYEQAWPRNVVLFLGRITFQKGPDYFVEAAARVVPHVPDVLFVMAGSGDMLPRMVNRVGELGLGQYFHFPGFLRGEDVEKMFSVADLYVMPSVSEPFGISALEAISFDTPVIISRQSGVSEVLSHALKVDFWDVDRLADLIINALVHDELRQDMVQMAREEVRRLHWDAAALKTIELYRRIV
jgi:glycosyltransferase involved in cell wall biosynthesis